MTWDLFTLWTVAGVGLLIAEMLTGSFVLVFIALGCFAGSLMASAGQPATLQILTVAAVSVLGAWFLRRPIQKRFLKAINLNADIGREIQIDQAIAPHQQTRITYQGTSWMATNLDAEALKQGDRVVIVGIDGNILLIRKLT